MTAGLYLGALALAFLSLLLVVLALRRVKNEETQALVQMVDRFGQQFERITVGLERTIAQAGDGQPDSATPEDVLTQTLRQACARLDVEAAVAYFPRPDGAARVVAVGLSDEDAALLARTGLPDSRGARSLEFAVNGDAGEPARAGLAVPLRAHDAQGMLVALTQAGQRRFADADVAALEELARDAEDAVGSTAATALSIALGTDAVTHLYNRNAFQSLLAEAVDRAQSARQTLALVVIDVDDFADVNQRLGQLGGDRVLATIGERLRELGADTAARVGGDAFAVILPRGRLADAEALFARLCASILRHPPAEAQGLRLSAGIAELRPHDDPLTLFERADEALSQAKSGGKGTAVAAGG